MMNNKTSLIGDFPNEDKSLYGWVCPKCGAVMSPFTSFCPNCTKQNFEITFSTDTGSGTTEAPYGE